MKNRMTLSEAASMVSRCKGSGLTVKDFCLRDQITVHRYYYWSAKLKALDSSDPGNIFPVYIEKPVPPKKFDPVSLEISYPNGIKVTVSTLCGAAVLRELIHIL